MQIDLQDLHVNYWDYLDETNPPILHQKDYLVTPDYPNYEKFAKLTRQEEDWGLLDHLHEVRVLKRPLYRDKYKKTLSQVLQRCRCL